MPTHKPKTMYDVIARIAVELAIEKYRHGFPPISVRIDGVSYEQLRLDQIAYERRLEEIANARLQYFDGLTLQRRRREFYDAILDDKAMEEFPLLIIGKVVENEAEFDAAVDRAWENAREWLMRAAGRLEAAE